jgi:hypothetical protein
MMIVASDKHFGLVDSGTEGLNEDSATGRKRETF